MNRQIRSALRRARSLRGVAPTERLTLVRSVVPARARAATKRARRRATTGQVRIVEMLFGRRAANQYFWRTPLRDVTWFNIQRRIESLTDRDPDAARHFVATAIEHTSDPVSVAGMARHPFSRDHLHDWLERAVDRPSPTFNNRVSGNRLLAGAFAGAARLLLEPDRADATVEWLTNLHQLPDSSLFEFMDSMGMAPNDESHRIGPTVGHRVIIGEQFGDTDSYALLLPGAERVTLLATSETFGKADFSDYADWPGVGEVVVEHVRSRITRFSREYVELHEATRTTAEQLTATLRDIPTLLDLADERLIATEIADFLFFQSLVIRAVEVLVADGSIDEIVIAFANHGESSEFVRLLSGVPGLVDDPRLNLVSVSRSAAHRSRFSRLVTALLDGDRGDNSPKTRVPMRLVLRKLDEEAQRLAAALSLDPPDMRPSVTMVTANSPAYNDSTAGYAIELAETVDVRLVHVGVNATGLVQELDERGAGDRFPIGFLTPRPERFRAFADVLTEHLTPHLPGHEACESPALQAAAWAARCGLRRLAMQAVGPSIVRMKSFDGWLERLTDAGAAPDLLVLTPHRSLSVLAMEVVARRYDIPSLVVEPHAQDANYSRYLKIAADYYGVMSDYFKSQVSSGFGIAPERVFTVGSPRQVAPASYDRADEQRQARADYTLEHGLEFSSDTTYLTFFCQPSEWAHVSKIWASCLGVAHDHDCRVFLKPHPEESISRVHLYLEQARASGSGDRVVLLDGDAETAIALADIVLTAYSAAAIDAALRGTPVVCLTEGDRPYPVDIPAIIGAPIARSRDELGTLVRAFRADPEPFFARANSLTERESQFVEGPGPRLRALVDEILDAREAAVRDDSTVPDSLFLDGPHPLFAV